MTPTIDVFITTIQSTQAIRSRHERVMRAMQAARVPFRTHDVAADEQAKRFWQKKDSTRELPCILVDDERVGVSSEVGVEPSQKLTLSYVPCAERRAIGRGVSDASSGLCQFALS